MPTSRRYRPQLRRRGLDEESLFVLLTGGDFFNHYTVEELRSLWAENRGDVLQQFIKEHPGERPCAWWQFDAPEPRRKVTTGGISVMNPIMRPCPDSSETSFGLPTMWMGSGGELHQNLYETQLEFLQRHNLLTKAEKKILGQ